MSPRIAILTLPLVLVACASPVPETPPTAPVVVTPEPVPEIPPIGIAPEQHDDKDDHLASRQRRPIAERPLNARAKCGFRDPNGYHGRLHLDVKDASVKQFEANIDVPKRGSCSFRLKNFRQIDALPIVVLSARQGHCKVRLWEQEHQVTVAFRDCHKECSGNSVDYLWPILVDNRKGSCA